MTLDVAIEHGFPAFALRVAFTAPTPGVTVLFGPSGCGKTTVLNAIAGLLAPQQGRVALDGDTLLDTANRIAIPTERRRCGVVFQDAKLFPHVSVATNLRYGLRRAPPSAPGPGFDEIVALLGLEPLLTRRPTRLSGGERQRVALGRALLARPRLLLMDEPLAALDSARKSEILPFLTRIRATAGVPILYVTHAMDEVDRLADTLVLMEHGKLLAAGPLEALATRTDLLLATRADAGAVLTATIRTNDSATGLTAVTFPGGELIIPLQNAPPGTLIRLRVQARDVAIATKPPEALSIQNILPATLATITTNGPETLLTLQIGPTTLLARITTEAQTRLSLTPNMPIWALIKSVAFTPKI